MMDGGPAGTILVVDDEDDLRRLLVLALHRNDFEVLEAATGEAALEILRMRPVDVLVLDMGLPGMSGVDVVRALRLRPETATLPVLLMTGSGTSASVIEGLEGGADDFLAKPVRLDELVARVRAHLRSRVAWSGLVEDELRVRASVVGALARWRCRRTRKPPPRRSSVKLARRTESHVHRGPPADHGDRLQPLADLHPGRGRRPRRDAPADPRRRVPPRPGTARAVGRRALPRADRPDSPFWDTGLELIAGAPIYSDEILVGLLLIGVAGEAPAAFHDRPAKLMAAAIDYASILTAVAGTALADRARLAPSWPGSGRYSRSHAYHAVFQPIVDLETRERRRP